MEADFQIFTQLDDSKTFVPPTSSIYSRTIYLAKKEVEKNNARNADEEKAEGNTDATHFNMLKQKSAPWNMHNRAEGKHITYKSPATQQHSKKRKINYNQSTMVCYGK